MNAHSRIPGCDCEICASPVQLPPELAAIGLKLRPVVSSDLAILEKCGSPLVRDLFTAATGGRPDQVYTHEQMWELVFIYTRPPAESRKALAGSRAEWIETVMTATADRIKMVSPQAVFTAIVENYVASFPVKPNN